MRTFLRWFIRFLDARFPERVVVTQSRYEALESKLVVIGHDSGALFERLVKLENEVRLLSAMTGIGNPADRAMNRMER